jgi:hypothetical protein
MIAAIVLGNLHSQCGKFLLSLLRREVFDGLARKRHDRNPDCG